VSKNWLHYRFAWIIFVIVLAACEAVPEKQAATILPATATTGVRPTETATDQPTATLTPTALPTETPTITPTPGKPFTMDDLNKIYAGLTSVYVSSYGNIFIKKGLEQPRRLTYSGKNYAPILSDDGQKVVFYRVQDSVRAVYSINVDGSKERLIISKAMFPDFDGEIADLTFVPQTHLLLFNMELCDPRTALYNAPDCIRDIYSVNTDSGKFRQLVKGLSGDAMQYHNFEVSPDGRYLAVAGLGHVDIFDINGKLVYPKALRYRITTPDEFLPFRYWLPDSSGFIAIVAVNEFNRPPDLANSFTVWRYTIADNTAVQLPFFPISDSPCLFSVSPDRNWIIFNGDRRPDENIKVYLGNLNSGYAKLFAGHGGCAEHAASFFDDKVMWSPDSKHFVFSSNTIGAIGSVFRGPSIPVGGHFTGWLDATHYQYFKLIQVISEKCIPGEGCPVKVEYYAAEIGGGEILLSIYMPGE
jgi:Tol biopolymer transport system component